MSKSKPLFSKKNPKKLKNDEKVDLKLIYEILNISGVFCRFGRVFPFGLPVPYVLCINAFPIIFFDIEGFVQFGCLFRSFHNLWKWLKLKSGVAVQKRSCSLKFARIPSPRGRGDGRRPDGKARRMTLFWEHTMMDEATDDFLGGTWHRWTR